ALEYPHVKIAGYRNGYFSKSEEEGIVQTIAESGANILFIGFGSPKKEYFVEEWKERFRVHVVHGVGGSFDVYAGKTKRAPFWMQNAGLEWLFRLLQEPRRMFWRYLSTNTAFLLLVSKELFKMYFMDRSPGGKRPV
ncbi:MAG: WecB/TagA/CpsF family glycosyltransferase, partial [Bacteroidota bacterium]